MYEASPRPCRWRHVRRGPSLYSKPQTHSYYQTDADTYGDAEADSYGHGEAHADSDG